MSPNQVPECILAAPWYRPDEKTPGYQDLAAQAGAWMLCGWPAPVDWIELQLREDPVAASAAIQEIHDRCEHALAGYYAEVERRRQAA